MLARGKERRRVGGLLSTPLLLGLVRPGHSREARRSYAGGGQRNVSRGGRAIRLAFRRRRRAPFHGPLWRSLAGAKNGVSRFHIGRCESAG